MEQRVKNYEATLQEVMTYYRIPVRVLAEVAGVEPVRIHLLLLGGCARRRDADRVLKALSQLTRYTWTYENLGGVRVYLEHVMA